VTATSTIVCGVRLGCTEVKVKNYHDKETMGGKSEIICVRAYRWRCIQQRNLPQTKPEGGAPWCWICSRGVQYAPVSPVVVRVNDDAAPSRPSRAYKRVDVLQDVDVQCSDDKECDDDDNNDKPRAKNCWTTLMTKEYIDLVCIHACKLLPLEG
jgi:hypothetical protein